MADYEVWGPDEDGDDNRLDVRSGELPSVGDTIEVDGKVRKVKRLSKHHSGGTAVDRVHVGQYGEGEPLPHIIP